MGLGGAMAISPAKRVSVNRLVHTILDLVSIPYGLRVPSLKSAGWLARKLMPFIGEMELELDDPPAWLTREVAHILWHVLVGDALQVASVVQEAIAQHAAGVAPAAAEAAAEAVVEPPPAPAEPEPPAVEPAPRRRGLGRRILERAREKSSHRGWQT